MRSPRSVAMLAASLAIASAFAVIEPSVSSRANADTADNPDAQIGPAMTTDFSGMTPDQIYEVKTAVTHEEAMAQEGASDITGTDAPAVGVSDPTASDTAATVTPMTVCTFASDGDYVHASTYSGVRYASGHGYWWNYTCPDYWRADVTIWLEEKLGTGWYQQGNKMTGYNRIPGSGSFQRVTAKMACVNFSTHQWRSVIIADIVLEPDTSPKAYPASQSIACY